MKDSIQITVPCTCPFCTNKDWDKPMCTCGHSLAMHSPNGPWCEMCQESHTFREVKP